MDASQQDKFAGFSAAELIAVILEQRDLIAKQNQLISDLQKRVRELEQQLGFDDRKPPPVAPKPPAPRSERRPRKKRPFNSCRRREPATKTLHHFPDSCPDCGRKLSGGSVSRTRQVIDIEPAPVQVTDHVIHERWCGVCAKRVRAKVDFSGLVCGKRRIGHNLAAWIAGLSIDAGIPVRTIQRMLKRMYAVHVSTGEIVDLLALVAQKGRDKLEAIKAQIRSSECLHADETGWKENGAYRCLWSLSTQTARWFHIDPSRSAKVAQQLIGDEHARTLVTDFYCVYNSILGRHQRCWAHFYRALEELRQHPLATERLAQWIDAVVALWRRGRQYRQFCLTKPPFGAGLFDRRRERKRLEEAIWALAEPFWEADKAVDPQATLARRIGLFLGELFTFVEFPEVPDDNNAAERAIRPAVVIRKICGGTRSPKGTYVKAALMSLFATWKLEGVDPIRECVALLAAPA